MIPPRSDLVQYIEATGRILYSTSLTRAQQALKYYEYWTEDQILAGDIENLYIPLINHRNPDATYKSKQSHIKELKQAGRYLQSYMKSCLESP